MTHLEIIAGGQTGVDLGAHLAALDTGVAIGGYMPADGRNEDGPIPAAVAMHLRRHDRTDPAARTRANVAHADAAIVIVPDRRRAGATRGTALTIRLCEKRDLPMRVIDPGWDAGITALWVSKMLECWRTIAERSFRLMVAGPRASLWPEGESEARRFVDAICRQVQS